MSWDETPVEEAEFDSAEASRFPWTEVDIAFALRWTRTAAGRQFERARQLAEDLPAVHQALLDGPHPKCTYHHRCKHQSGAEVLQLTPGGAGLDNPPRHAIRHPARPSTMG
jgi:hypothetical protein